MVDGVSDPNPCEVHMRISVVIPTYNAEEHISACLASIAKQSVKPFEVIVVDGLSKDGTLDAVKQFEHLLPLKVISEKDKGQSEAVSKGLRLATGDIAHWHAADDLVMPGAFEAVIRAFDDPNVGLVYSDGWAFDDHQLMRGGCCRWTRFETAHLFFGRFQSDCAYWRHTFTPNCLPLDENMPLNCDEDWFLRIWALSKKATWLPLRLGAFRIRTTQLSQNLSRGNLNRDRTVSRERVREMLGISPVRHIARKILWAPRYLVVDKTMYALDLIWSRLYRRGSRLMERAEFLRFLLNEWSVPDK